jgi:hypothetical protein
MATECVWHVLLEISIPPGTVDHGGGVGFINIYLWAKSNMEAFGGAEDLLQEYGWILISRENAHPVDLALHYEDELLELIEDVRQNHAHRRYGPFYSYKPQ